MKSFPSIKRLGHKDNQGILDEGRLVVTEKTDGCNTRFTLHESGELLFGSRNVEFKEDGKPSDRSINDRFKGAVEFVRKYIDVSELREVQAELGADLVFFGENMVKHTISYNWSETPQFLGFAVYDQNSDEWLDPVRAKDVFYRINLPFVPLVAVDLDPEDFDEDIIPESEFRDGKAEGVVIWNRDIDGRYLKNFVAKLKTEEFKEKQPGGRGQPGNAKQVISDTREILKKKIDKNAPEKTKLNQFDNAASEIRTLIMDTMKTHGDEFVGRYCTEARVRKHINRMRDEGHELSMELMGKGLYKRVARDILEEEALAFVEEQKKIDFDHFVNSVANKCAQVLQQVIKERALE